MMMVRLSPIVSTMVGIIAATLIVAGCANQPGTPRELVADEVGFDSLERDYLNAAALGESVYTLGNHDSVVQILVYRSGALARLGHDHAVTGRSLRGYAWLPDDELARADVILNLAEMVVDEAEGRQAAGFTSEPSAADRDGTYRNMLASLDVDQFPSALLRVSSSTLEPLGEPHLQTVAVDLTLHGTTRQLAVPVFVVEYGDGFRVAGSFKIRQTDFGIKPFSVFGGALAVRDELDLHFDLIFHKFRVMN